MQNDASGIDFKVGVQLTISLTEVWGMVRFPKLSDALQPKNILAMLLGENTSQDGIEASVWVRD